MGKKIVHFADVLTDADLRDPKLVPADLTNPKLLEPFNEKLRVAIAAGDIDAANFWISLGATI